MNLIGQLIGVVAMVLCFLIYQQKERRQMIFVKMLADSAFMLHYILLGAYSGAAICVTSITRAIVFLNPEKKWANKRVWVPIFFAMSLFMAYLVWKDAFSICPLIASVISIISFSQNKPKISRILAFPVSVSLLIYDFHIVSLAGIINESALIISSIIGILRFDRKTK